MALSEEDRKRIRRDIRRHRAAPNIIRNGSIPVRGHTFDDDEVFTGLPGNRLAMGAVGTDELGGQVVTEGKLGNLSVTTAKLAVGAVDTGKIAGQSVGTSELANLSVTTAKIDALAVDAGKIATQAVGNSKLANGAVDNAKIDDAIKNPGQQTYGLRTIGQFLGGSSFQAAASDHSHGSGNSTDFDLLPQAHQDRILLARQRIRNNIGKLDVLTALQFRLFVRELAIVAVAALNLEVDAPDYTAEERATRRKAGNPLPLFTEWRAQAQTLHDPSMPRYTEGFTDVGTVSQDAPGL